MDLEPAQRAAALRANTLPVECDWLVVLPSALSCAFWLQNLKVCSPESEVGAGIQAQLLHLQV